MSYVAHDAEAQDTRCNRSVNLVPGRTFCSVIPKRCGGFGLGLVSATFKKGKMIVEEFRIS